MTDIVVVAHNIRSAHNVGSIFRTADGFGVSKLILSGYTPYPRCQDDPRLPHVSEKLTSQIHKSALGAELLVTFDYQAQPDLASLRQDGYVIAGLEQDERSIELREYHSPEKIALLLGEEVHGLTDELKWECDVLLEIPMHGKKESFNVSVAAGIALYALSV
jgi:23S rRNA (guanosine2251-2'-O)-methyltransferase